MEQLVYYFYRLFTGLIKRLPLPTAFRVGAALGSFAWFVAGPYRRVVRRNLRIAFPEKDESALRDLAREHFRHLGANLFSSLRIAVMPPAAIDEFVEIEHFDRMVAALERGQGVIMMISHIGNWEVFAQLAHHLPGRGLATIYQPLGNRLIDEDIRSARGKRGVQPLSRREGFTAAVRILKENGVVGVLVDQHAGDGGIWTPLFDRLSSTSPLTATLAGKTGAAILPMAVYTVGEARWKLTVSEPIPITADKGTTTAEINQVLEKQIRVSPADWFWVHERWKSPNPSFLLTKYRRGLAFPAGYDRARLQPFQMLVRSSNWLGDAVMCVPAVRAIKAGRIDAHVTVLVKEKLADFWRAVPEVDAIETIGEGDSILSVGRRLRDRFDAAIVLPNSLRTALEPWLARIPRRVGHPGHHRRWLLNQVFDPQPEEGAPAEPPPHQVYHYLNMAAWLGADIAASTPPVRRPPPTQAPLKIGICPGAEYGPAKRYPAERFLAAALAVGREREVQWTLFGVAGDAPVGAPIAAGLGEQCRNLIGQTTLKELMSELTQCHLLLTNDTGTMHLAAFLGVPVVAVFGSTEPALTGPFGPGHTIVRRHVECSPCFYRKCPIDFRCMLEIEPAQAARAVMQSTAARASAREYPA